MTTQADPIEAMLAELLRRSTPPEALGGLWTTFPWLTPPSAPEEPHARQAWLEALGLAEL